MKNDVKQCEKCKRFKECQKGKNKVRIDAYGRCMDFIGKVGRMSDKKEITRCLRCGNPNDIFKYCPEGKAGEPCVGSPEIMDVPKPSMSVGQIVRGLQQADATEALGLIAELNNEIKRLQTELNKQSLEGGIYVSEELLEMSVIVDPDMSGFECGANLREVIADLKEQLKRKASSK